MIKGKKPSSSVFIPRPGLSQMLRLLTKMKKPRSLSANYRILI